ncbi:MAG: GTPase ObgE, partial [Bacteroidales bacterium]|nr:GTPase ObgE [Bacteroidales bacterium]
GNGSAHLARTAQTPKGGPDGGDGGRGGHIILRGNAQLWTLLHLKYTKHVVAEDGEDGGKNQRFGKNGRDIIVEVPLGTIVRNEENMEKEAEILEDKQEIIFMRGGRGGLGNTHFKSSVRQTPRFAQTGESGSEGWKILELQVLADVGLVGFPNAGKSTFISVVSNARPKIANYPFTTLKPNLGMVPYRDNYSFVVADIPGIIEGASEGKGLGLRFLRHIERNSVLMFIVPADSDDIIKEYRILLNELKQYNPELLDKQRLLAVSKCDLVPPDELDKLKKSLHADIPLLFMSAHAQFGIMEVKDMLWKLLH